MCLRKSPVRTAAMLAANRDNARKSSRPRTAAGKRASAMNALRSGFYSRAAWLGEPRNAGEEQAFASLCQALRVAVVAAGPKRLSVISPVCPAIPDSRGRRERMSRAIQ